MDFNKPDITQSLEDVLADIRDFKIRAATFFNQAVTDTNVPDGARRYSGVGKRFEQRIGGAWVELAALYEMTVRRAENLAGYLPSVSAVLDTVPVRNASGLVEGGITGNAATATKLATARNISAAGADVVSAAASSFDGSANIALNLILTNSGVTAGSYGASTKTLQATVDVKGRITALSAVDIAFPAAYELTTAKVLAVLPSLTGNEGKSLRVNSGASGVEWGSAGVTSVVTSVVATNPDAPTGTSEYSSDKINSLTGSIADGVLTLTLSITHKWVDAGAGGDGE